MTNHDKKTIVRFLGLLKTYWGKIVLLMLAILLSVGLSLLSPMLSREMMDRGLMQKNWMVIIRSSLLLFLLRQASSLLSIWIERKRLRVAYDFRYRMEKQAVEHLMAMKTNYFHQIGQSELLSQIDVDVNYICSILNTNTLSIVASVFTIIGGLMAAVAIEGKMVLMVLAVLPIKYGIIHVHSRAQKKRLHIFLEKNMAYAKWFGEIVGGMTDIRIYGLEKKKLEEFTNYDGEKIAAHKDMDVIAQYRQLADGTLDALLNLLILMIGGFLVVRGKLTVGSLYAFISYSSYILSPLSSILNLRVVLTGILPSAARFFEFLDQEEEGANGTEHTEGVFGFWNPEPGDERSNQQTIVISGLLDSKKADERKVNWKELGIECRNVFFHYQNAAGRKNVIDSLCLHIPQGEKVALIGKNGSGKTTLVHLLLRLYDIQGGSILIGGNDISGLDLKEYRKLFSVVSQQIYLFNDTIRNNISMCQEFDDKAVYAAMEEVGLGELAKERGLDFVVGINGACLSGGQKQKIALARALLHDRPVFIFDEATSNTDIDFEARFRRMLKRQLTEKTVILVTHNAELLQEADRIVFMEEGKVLCEGRFEELLMQNKAFARLMEQYRSNTEQSGFEK